MFQDSFQRTSDLSQRGTVPNNYCDVQRRQLNTSTSSYAFVTKEGLTSVGKCTHFFTVAAGIGGPAIHMNRSDWSYY